MKLTIVRAAAEMLNEAVLAQETITRALETRRHWEAEVAKAQRDLEEARRKTEAYKKEVAEWETMTSSVRQRADELLGGHFSGLTAEERQELLKLFETLANYPRP